MASVVLVAPDGVATRTVTTYAELVHLLQARGYVPQSGTVAQAVAAITGIDPSSPPVVPTPAELANHLVTGEEVLPRDLMTSGSLQLTSGTVRLSYFTARKTEQTSQVRLVSGSTAAGATPTLFRVGLYSIDSSAAGTLVASTASDTALFAAATTVYTKSWSSAYAKVAGQRYALAVLVVTGATAPSISGVSPTSSAEALLPPRLTGALSAQSDLPSTFTDASLASSFSRFYGAIA